MTNPYARETAPEWIVPTAAAAIVGIAIAAAVLSWLLGDFAEWDSFTAWMLRASLFIVGVSNLYVVPLVLRSMRAAASSGANIGGAQPEERARPASPEGHPLYLLASFSLAESIYGAVGALVTHAWWYALMLAPIGLLLLYLNAPLAREVLAKRNEANPP
jgi:hypothetical protein